LLVTRAWRGNVADAVGEWRVDPYGRHEFRYWDGTEWTEHVSDRGAPSTDAPIAGRAVPPPPGARAALAPPPTSASVVYVHHERTNGLAIASMVLGIIWIYWIGSILAVIFGHVALSQIKKSEGMQRGRGMAIAGLVLGYVGVATLVLVLVLAASVTNSPSS
jgi:hypothetical protein